MLSQSRIEVWYKVARERILLGETCSSDKMDVINLWVSLPHDSGSPDQQGYHLSLFDDDGRCIGEKPVTLSNAEAVLKRRPKFEQLYSVNQLVF
ncbi:30S ribosomal protein S6 modification protein [Vibrio sp. HA2012]|uniref:30S ribosomal protein S6 modification protein n=1 Tax=Vibrio sp. HA2012 TaxID=1971595 RepID=UPI000C2BE87F|nr:30S ribosomal protein S6 modification protein [Vibrio sp. HA2012]PJC88025.1 30S ribosomal protein S6 modification protein [Vibrio sp. HA2012]